MGLDSVCFVLSFFRPEEDNLCDHLFLFFGEGLTLYSPTSSPLPPFPVRKNDFFKVFGP